MDYWKECIAEACEDAGLAVTDDQVGTIASWAEGAHDNYSQARGHDVIGSPVETMAQEELREMKREKDKQEGWERSTKPCPSCCTTGCVTDCWGRDVTCGRCGGKGRI